ncbi:hypothetical protein X744_00245 [Mesorhizobium sp. LNJC372A00]|nr:hypothetical protein X750_07020 [Mesorhizobium sp. LNJC394B00]ESY62109.1 hypothetical protein X744_00245 [Mesorhizobium sp. LNJC372A00]
MWSTQFDDRSDQFRSPTGEQAHTEVVATGLETGRKPITVCRQSMMPKSVKRFSDDIMLYLFDLEPDSDFRSIRREIIRL